MFFYNLSGNVNNVIILTATNIMLKPINLIHRNLYKNNNYVIFVWYIF